MHTERKISRKKGNEREKVDPLGTCMKFVSATMNATLLGALLDWLWILFSGRSRSHSHKGKVGIKKN